MGASNIYSPALLDHVQHPDHRETLAGATHTHEGVNPSCGDDLTIQLRVDENGVIEKVAWTGSGCAVSQASADMMADLLEGASKEEARELAALFAHMVRGDVSMEKAEEALDEAACLASISHMPARVKCAELAWRTLDEMLQESGVPASPTTTEDSTSDASIAFSGEPLSPPAEGDAIISSHNKDVEL